MLMTILKVRDGYYKGGREMKVRLKNRRECLCGKTTPAGTGVKVLGKDKHYSLFAGQDGFKVELPCCKVVTLIASSKLIIE